jgi:hypothetical protein
MSVEAAIIERNRIMIAFEKKKKKESTVKRKERKTMRKKREREREIGAFIYTF